MPTIPYKRYVTVLLLIVYIFHRTDSTIFGFLMEPIKRELDLSDTELGFLAGPALVLFYATLGVPIARWADRSHRVNIMAIAITLWSGIVTLSSMVTTFWQFALARIGVGIGEAGFSAIAQSVVSDYHSAKERTRAISTFMLAIPFAGVVSSLMGGWISEAYGWRAVFVAAGAPGIILALMVKFTIKEPVRAAAVPGLSTHSERPPMSEVWSTLWGVRTLRHLAFGQALVNVTACFLAWFPPFFMRNHNMGLGELGTWLALTTGIGGGAGIWLGGYLTSRYGAQDERVKLTLMTWATAFIAPTALLAVWCPWAYLALLLLLPFKILLHFCYGPTFSFVQGLVPPGMRATMASVFILTQVLAGGVLGIQMLGVLSDVLTPMLGSGMALRWGMTLASPLALWAAGHFWLASRYIRDDAVAESSGAEMPVKSTA